MSDLLIPFALLAFIALFAYAVVSTARQQRAGKNAVFRDFAQRHGLRYQPEDDGTARGFGSDLDGIGRFESASLGDVIPEDVCTGTLDGWNVVLFRHSTRFHEGYAQEWFVAGIETDVEIVRRCAIQLFRGRAEKDSMYLTDSIVSRQHVDSFDVQVRAPDEASSRSALDADILVELARLARNLPFRPEVQIRSNRIAVYPGNRNDNIDTVDDLRKLVDYARDVAVVLLRGLQRSNG